MDPTLVPSRKARRAMAVVWPAFLMAGVLEMLVFSVVDPQELRWFGSVPVELSTQAVYTLAFVVFWVVLMLASSLSLLLMQLPEHEGGPAPRAPGWPR
ncbi:MAG: hypothetical protein DI603_01340 [Roseateles depolymerans]|uniref:Transmembrane protein n=1 Tax=Roseateles depolymerans TaxID=76731 RepID=A0A2W5E1M1_9BURK|nr:MAG: hypothetical protein DI603_01340 [Roseateles depolymerans]